MADVTPGTVLSPTLEEKIAIAETLHPATVDLLETFEYGHLPPELQVFSQPFHDLAWHIAQVPSKRGSERTTCLRKLREAKDCAVIMRVPIGKLTSLLGRTSTHP